MHNLSDDDQKITSTTYQQLELMVACNSAAPARAGGAAHPYKLPSQAKYWPPIAKLLKAPIMVNNLAL